MDQTVKHLAILFADIANSTYLYEKLGNVTAQALIAKCLFILSGCVFSRNGTIIKTIGDEIMCTFPTAAEAITAATHMHQSIEMMNVSEFNIETPPNLYIGIEYGAVVTEDNDIFGDAVNVAARMVSKAKQRQTLTTEDTCRKLSPELRESACFVDTDTIKGKSGEYRIYEIVWELQAVTLMKDCRADDILSSAAMDVSTKTTAVRLDRDHPVLTLGRQPHNDLVVTSHPVSRSHARIEYRKGKFILIDQSRNGTFVMMDDKNHQVRNDEIQLCGTGRISLGEAATPASPHAIRFSITLD